MKDNKKMELAHWASKYATENGAKEVSVSVYDSKESEVEVRKQKIEKIQESIESGLSIKLYVNGKYSTHSTNRLKKNELERFIKEAILGTNYLAEDKYRSLPDRHLCYDGEEKDLKLFDSSYDTIDPRQKIDLAMQVEAETIGMDDRIITVSGSYGDGSYRSYMVLSNGVEGFKESTSYSVSASASINGGDSRPSDYHYNAARFWNQLSGEGVGKYAVERALRKIGAKKIKSGKMEMLIENRSVGRVFSSLLQPLFGYNIQQKRSFLEGKIGHKIATDLLTITDNPFIESGRNSRLYDSDGLAARKMAVIENGVLRTYYIGDYYGKKLEMEPTTGSSSNLIFKSGTKNLEGLTKDMDEGILVTGFNGGNSNPATGDFSVGVEGFYVKKGVIIHPVSGMNITGNHKDVWNQLIAVGNDPLTNRSWQTPSMMFEGIDFSGL
ncbi:TldD/PmbA family protein [Marinifilum sp. N1E240]|uniref:TldD/PmbA family protein n=1 Tax=Marinifilum sp. N1E240 TaxID=2608082 RepID=UPI00128DD5E8|nr:TldD/PmbA family protein [Marinifilum sp. N1E240]MPQ46157.1 TldD/PmbA family protein [Marinifilum sp. N1E240]